MAHLPLTKQELAYVPAHIAIIMDGNGRWASRKGLPRTEGHRVGAETFRHTAEFFNTIGVKCFTVYAFSTENWRRPAYEVEVIMTLLEKYLLESIDSMVEKNIRLNFFGDMTALPSRLRNMVERTKTLAAGCTGLTVNVCLNYGGRQEIVRAARAAAQKCLSGELSPEAINEDSLSALMYSAGCSDPDLIIRPGEEMRISNFLLWQSAYSEYYFTDTLWPDMDEEALTAAIRDYMKRKRRFGAI